MDFVTLPCNHCGKSLRVPVFSKYLRCNACGVHLTVRTEDSVTVTEVVEESVSASGRIPQEQATPQSNGASAASTDRNDNPAAATVDNLSQAGSQSQRTVSSETSPATRSAVASHFQSMEPGPARSESHIDRDVWRQALLALDRDWESEKQSLGVSSTEDDVKFGGKAVLAIWASWAVFSAILIGIGFYLFTGFGVLAISVCLIIGIALAVWMQQAATAWEETDHFRAAERRYRQRRDLLLSKLHTAH